MRRGANESERLKGIERVDIRDNKIDTSSWACGDYIEIKMDPK